MLKKTLILIWCLLALPFTASAFPSDQLTDISGHSHEEGIRTLVDAGVWPLAPNQATFNPNGLITLQDQLVIMFKAAGLYDEASLFVGGQCPQSPLYSYARSKKIFTGTSCPSMSSTTNIYTFLVTSMRTFKLSDASALAEYNSMVASYSGPNLKSDKTPYGIPLNDFKCGWESDSLVDFSTSKYSLSSNTYSTTKITRGQAASLVANLFDIQVEDEIDPATPVAPSLEMAAPLAGTTLPGTTVTFTWAAPGANSFDVAVGPTPASPGYGWFGGINQSQVVVEDLPEDGTPVHVRIFAYFDNQTIVKDYQFTSGVPPPPPAASGNELISPAPGSTLSGSTQTFSWVPEDSTRFDVAVGSNLAGANYAWFDGVTQPTITVNNLPTNGSDVWVRVFYYLADGTNPGRDYKFIAASGTTGSGNGTSNGTPPTSGGTTGSGTTGGTTGSGTTGGTTGGTTTPPTPGVSNCSNPVGSPGSLTSVWANDGGDKVVQEDTRGSCAPNAVVNSIWDGAKINLFGAKNEVVNFNLILEAALGSVSNISVAFNKLTGPSGFEIKSQAAQGDALFDYTNRDIELFFVRYLEIKGLSNFCCATYDERHVPVRLRRPWSGAGIASGNWSNRPEHNKHYPDIAVPMELKSSFAIAGNNNQSIWSDIYIPKNAPAGVYTGEVAVSENGVVTKRLPIELKVYNFALPDAPNSKTMLYMGYGDINKRYLNERYPYTTSDVAMSQTIRDRHFMMAHRHKISLIDADTDNAAWTSDAPRPQWIPRLNGSLFTAANGYRGPGEGVGNGIYSIGSYGSWGWKTQGEAGMRTHTDNWANWFAANAPTSDYFLYLIDESSNYTEIQQWANWINNNPGPGRNVKSMATTSVLSAKNSMSGLDIPTTNMYVGDKAPYDGAMSYFKNDASKKVYFYNGGRPASGSFMTEDDGVALRELAWGQYKKGIDRWFYWESTYYNNYQAGMGETNVFAQAHTFGANGGADASLGDHGWNYSNGDGVLFYPGTDKVFPAESYNVNGPIASLRLKHWRRGIQDVDYLALAKQKNPAAVDAIINRVIPKVLWENGVNDPNDPTWVRTDISWSTNPDDWEDARQELADIIAQ